jgi:predicted flap endonuclease-1-like 5' DNA nuclease
MNNTAKNAIRVVGVVVSLGAAVWALRDRLLPAPEIPDGPPPKFREPSATADTPPPADLTAVKGIGPKTSAKLTDAGIADLATLAAADAAAVAEAADTSETMAARWIESAASLT